MNPLLLAAALFVKVLVVLFVLIQSFPAAAAALPVSNMQNSISGVVQSKAQARGFASNDPRYGATLANIGGAIAGAAATAAVVTAAGVTAPAWITAGGAMLVGSLVTTGVSLAAGGLIKWIFGADGNVTYGENNNVAGGYAPLTLYCVNYSCATSIEAACKGIPESPTTNGTYFYGLNPRNSAQCNVFIRYTNGQVGDVGPAGYPQPTASSCIGYRLSASGGACPASNFPVPAPKSPSDAAASVPAAERAKPLNPQIVADLANQAWKRAASAPGYDGLPFVASDPITTQDVQRWQQANPTYYPNVGDALAPQPAPSGGTAASPFQMPVSSSPASSYDPATAPTPGTNPAAENPLANLGADPGIGMPTLEATPSAAMIIDPVFSLLPSLKTYSVPQHSAVCPKGVLNVFARQVAVDAHCDLLEQQRSLLNAVMVAAWAILALSIVLSA